MRAILVTPNKNRLGLTTFYFRSPVKFFVILDTVQNNVRHCLLILQAHKLNLRPPNLNYPFSYPFLELPIRLHVEI